MKLASDGGDPAIDVNDILDHVFEKEPDQASQLAGIDPLVDNYDVRGAFRHGQVRTVLRLSAARNRGEDFGRLKYAEEEELFPSQLPCWADLTPEQYGDRIAEMVEEIEAEARADREARGVESVGVEAILRQDPHVRPNQTKKSPAPACHAASKVARKKFREAYSAFVAAFRDAAEKLKAGEWPVRFPLGSFPPALPFVGAYPALPP